jgi:hypothetical protein
MQEESADNEAVLSLEYTQQYPNSDSVTDSGDLVETFWEEKRDKNGNVSFVNVDTGEIRYELPGVTPLQIEEGEEDESVVVGSFINTVSEKITKKSIDKSVKRITRKEERKKFQASRLQQAQHKNSLITDKLLSAYPNSAPPIGHPDYVEYMKRKVCHYRFYNKGIPIANTTSSITPCLFRITKHTHTLPMYINTHTQYIGSR